MKEWLKLPSFWLAVVLSAAFLIFGLPTLFGAGSGLIQWGLGAVALIVIGVLWYAVYKGAKTLRDSAHAVRDFGREVRSEIDERRK